MILLLLETALLVDETFELLEVALLLTTELAEVDTGLATVVGLVDDEDEVFFELEETGFELEETGFELEEAGLLVDLAVVFEDEVEVGFLDEDVMVDLTEVTTLT